MGAKNLCGKTVPQPHRDNAYEVWETPNGQWRWFVLKKYQADDKKPGARWYTLVESPYTPNGEYGDSYASDVIENAVRVR